MTTGWSVEDSCECPEDAFDGRRPHYGVDCPAHGGEVREIAATLRRWAADNNATPHTDVAKVHLRLSGAVDALETLLEDHWRHEAPGPVPSPTGSCGSCGGTGEVFHGFGENGPIFDGACGCETPFCGGCGDAWPCPTVETIGRAAGAPFAMEGVS